MIRRWLSIVWLRLRSLTRGSEVDHALRQELEFHLEAQVAENVARGMRPSEAREAALRLFGPPARVAEECRDTRRVSVIQNLGRDFRYTGRSLLRQPLLVAAAALSIAAAVAANGVIFSLANELLLAAPDAHRADRLAYIRMGESSHVSYPQWRDLNESGALGGVAGYQIEIDVNWSGAERAETLLPLVVTPNFFDVVGVPLAAGRGFTAAEAQPGQPGVAVISHAFWMNRLGADPGAVGRVLTFNGQPHTVLGRLPAKLRAVPGLGIAPEIYLPLSRHIIPALESRGSSAVMLIGRLHERQTLEQGRAAFALAAAGIEQRLGTKEFAGVRQFAAAGGVRRIGAFDELGVFFIVLAVVGGLVLTIACANVAGLLLSRATIQRREIALRAALGASRSRLVQQLLAEAGWLALAGTSLGLALAYFGGALLSRIRLPVPLPIELHPTVDVRMLLLAACLLTAATLLCGLVPALQMSHPSLLPVLKTDEARRGQRRWSIRSSLVVGQVAVALVLLVTALLFVRNLGRARHLDPGFDTSQTLVAEIGFVEGRYTADSRAAFLDELTNRLRTRPDIRAAAYAQGVPLTLRSGMTTGTDLQLADGGAPFRALYQSNFVGPEYFSTMGIRLVRGREFAPRDRPGAPAVAIVNEEFVRRHLDGRNPLGLHLLLPGPREQTYPVEIVGVVGNSKHRTIGEERQAAIYESFLQRGNRGRFVHVLVGARAAPELLIRELEQMVGTMDPTAAVKVTPMRSALAFAFLPSQLGAAVLGALGGLGLCLAMVGLYATVAYAVSRRTAEIGIRMALGATASTVLRLVLRDVITLAGIGIVLGLAVAALVTRPLAMFLVTGLSPADPLTFAGTAALLLFVSLAAAAGPARRAIRIDPVTSLRAE